MSWIADAIIYQINLRTIAAREPRNPIEAASEADAQTSTLAYLIRNLDVVAELGISVLHLMPPFPIGKKQRKGIGSPYAARSYQDVDEEYGTLTELKALVRAAHRLELKVMVGMVPNHTSRDHVWTIAHPSFYLRRPDGSPDYDADWSDTAKLDYTQPEVREAMIETLDFWLSFGGESPDGSPEGVDGFRVDMAHLINDLGFWNQALPELRRRHPQRQLLFLAECYGPAHSLDLFQRGFDAAYDDDFYKVCQNLYGLDENGNTCILPSPDASRQPGFEDTFKAFLDRGIAGAMEAVLLHYEDRLPVEAQAPRLARYTDNHDEGRGIYRFGDGAVLAVNQLLFLAGHSLPFLLAGQEFGALNRPSIHERIRTCDKGPRRRQGETQTLEAGIEFEGNLFARGRLRRRGWYAFYRELIALRAQCPELIHGDFSLLEAAEKCPQHARTVMAFQRRLGDSVLRCAVNLGPEPRSLAHANLFRHKPIYGGLVDGVMGPFTSVVVRTTI